MRGGVVRGGVVRGGVVRGGVVCGCVVCGGVVRGGGVYVRTSPSPSTRVCCRFSETHQDQLNSKSPDDFFPVCSQNN